MFPTIRLPQSCSGPNGSGNGTRRPFEVCVTAIRHPQRKVPRTAELESDVSVGPQQ